jgi:two-component system response regulator MprA
MLRILVVDDEPALRDTLSRALRRAGHEAVVVGDGRSGLEALRQDSFDAVITDIFMPDCDGIELIREMRAGRHREPVLAISGGGTYGNDLLLPMARMLGAQATLRKPFAPSEVVAAVETIAGAEAARRT